MGGAQSDDILEHLAANLRRQRRAKGLTQEGLADKLKVDVRYLQRIERGAVNIGLVTLARLAAALDVTPGTLLCPAKLPAPQQGRPAKRKGR